MKEILTVGAITIKLPLEVSPHIVLKYKGKMYYYKDDIFYEETGDTRTAPIVKGDMELRLKEVMHKYIVE